mgnify:CR=1 FL=1
MIRKNTGFNFKELLQRKRLNKSVELMCETDLPISDIIAAVGYENGSYFTVYLKNATIRRRERSVWQMEKKNG